MNRFCLWLCCCADIGDDESSSLIEKEVLVDVNHDERRRDFFKFMDKLREREKENNPSDDDLANQFKDKSGESINKTNDLEDVGVAKKILHL